MLSSHSIEIIENVPARQFVRMETQTLVPWTPARLVRAALAWVMAEVPAEGATAQLGDMSS
jgi:hypothetical protein